MDLGGNADPTCDFQVARAAPELALRPSGHGLGASVILQAYDMLGPSLHVLLLPFQMLGL